MFNFFLMVGQFQDEENGLFLTRVQWHAICCSPPNPLVNVKISKAGMRIIIQNAHAVLVNEMLSLP